MAVSCSMTTPIRRSVSQRGCSPEPTIAFWLLTIFSRRM